MSNSKGKKEFMVDNKAYPWGSDQITGAEIRDAAGVPETVQIFQIIPGAPDKPIADSDTVDLRAPGIERFSTDTANSGAGDNGFIA